MEFIRYSAYTILASLEGSSKWANEEVVLFFCDKIRFWRNCSLCTTHHFTADLCHCYTIRCHPLLIVPSQFRAGNWSSSTSILSWSSDGNRRFRCCSWRRCKLYAGSRSRGSRVSFLSFWSMELSSLFRSKPGWWNKVVGWGVEFLGEFGPSLLLLLDKAKLVDRSPFSSWWDWRTLAIVIWSGPRIANALTCCWRQKVFAVRQSNPKRQTRPVHILLVSLRVVVAAFLKASSEYCSLPNNTEAYLCVDWCAQKNRCLQKWN